MKPLQKFAMLLAKAKYLIDLGSGPLLYLIWLNSCVSSSDKWAAIIGIPSKTILLVGIPLGVILIFLLGCFLDTIKFPHFYQEEGNKRNLMLNEIREGKKR